MMHRPEISFSSILDRFRVRGAAGHSRKVQVFERVAGSFQHVVAFPLTTNCWKQQKTKERNLTFSKLQKLSKKIEYQES